MRLIFKLLALTICLIAPSNAYYYEFADYDPDGVVQLYYDGNEAAHLASPTGAIAAGDMLIQFAKDYGRTVTRSRAAIWGEIQLHALGWLAGEHSHSNPMDISIN